MTDSERAFLEGKETFSKKRLRQFLESLLPRLKACDNDIRLLKDAASGRRKKPTPIPANSFLGSWAAENWLEIYNMQQLALNSPGDSILASQVREIFQGRVRWKSVDMDGKQKRLYWFDIKDHSQTDYDHIFEPDHQLRGIKPKNIRQTLREALRIQREHNREKRHVELQLIIIPNSESEAITIQEIKKRLMQNS